MARYRRKSNHAHTYEIASENKTHVTLRSLIENTLPRRTFEEDYELVPEDAPDDDKKTAWAGKWTGYTLALLLGAAVSFFMGMWWNTVQIKSMTDVIFSRVIAIDMKSEVIMRRQER